MEDLSLHIMDIVENSLRAGASRIDIRMIENKKDDFLTLEIEDNGKGMDKESLENAANPFYTTKQGKKFGLGLSMLSQACREAEGEMKIESCTGEGTEAQRHRGTKVIATFKMDHIDMKPIGDIEKTLKVLRATHPEVNLSFDYVIKQGTKAQSGKGTEYENL
ncbi:MAG: sensor histidine kinase [Candidatus Hydrogenedentota bacterium]